MPVGRESSFDEFVCKIFEFAIQDAFCFLYSKLSVPKRFDCVALSAREKEFRRMLPAPARICFTLRRNTFLQPSSQWTILPVVSRNLFANPSGPHAQGITDAKHQPARAELSIKRVQGSEIIEHVMLLPALSSLLVYPQSNFPVRGRCGITQASRVDGQQDPDQRQPQEDE